jgi:hypothetical protein
MIVKNFEGTKKKTSTKSVKKIRTFSATIDKRKENKQQQQDDEIEYWQPFYFTHGNIQDTFVNHYWNLKIYSNIS